MSSSADGEAIALHHDGCFVTFQFKARGGGMKWNKRFEWNRWRRRKYAS